jgi:cytoskeletal protein RodZ
VCARGAAQLEGDASALAATQELDSFEGVADARHPAPRRARSASRGQRAPMSMRAWAWLSVAGVILAIVTLGSVLRLKARDAPQEYTTVTALTGAAPPPGAPQAQTTATEASATAAPPSGEPSAAPTGPAEPAASAEAAPAPRARRKPAPRAAVASAPVAKPPPDTTSMVTTPPPEPAPQTAVDPFDLQ